MDPSERRLRLGKKFFSLLLITAALACPGVPKGLCGEPVPEVFHREMFLSLDAWTPVFFPKIKRHSTYEAVVSDGVPTLLARSDKSASAIRLTREYDVFRYPKLSWSWKISRVYDKGDATKKSGDDYPIRVYVMFRYDPAKAATWQKLKYGAARKIYGEYPPHSALLYIWANRAQEKRIITNPYTASAKMVILEAGKLRVGRWIDESVDVLSDYREAFGSEPPAGASLAVMNDSDNTGESSVSWLRNITIHR
ncbi:MAG: DUF3047 domain-containing protein [Deltaproteobacteria bacterium]|nr:DUF3047 domain-containing protein [Deltaproteobacteria bacterium]